MFPCDSSRGADGIRRSIGMAFPNTQTDSSNPMGTEVIETTAGEIAAEVARRGVGPMQRVTVTIDADQSASPIRPKLAEIVARMQATAAARGLTTEIFDDIVRARD